MKNTADLERVGSDNSTFTPWFDEYQQIIYDTGGSEHETFNHPVACLNFVLS